MSSIVLSAATRQSLLAAQDTASLLGTTQTRLSTGKKVNSALDDPTNFFTASALDARSSALSSLLDTISNGIQTIQVANQGITSIKKLTDQLKSTAQQALSSSNAFTTKAASVSTALTGADATNLLSSGATVATGTAVGATSGSATASAATGSVTFTNDAAVNTAFGSADKTFVLDGVSITTDHTTVTTKAALLDSINTQLAAGGSGVTVAYDTNALKATGTSDGGTFAISGADKATFFGTTVASSGGTFIPTGATLARSLGFANGDTFKVNGATVSVDKGDTLDLLAQKITKATGGAVSAAFDPAAGGKFKLTAKDGGTGVTLADGSTATSLVTNLKLSTTAYKAGTGTTGSLNALDGKALTVKVGNGTSVSVNFGTNASVGQVSTLDGLNAALSPANAQASIDATGKITVTSTNEAGAENLTLSGSATGSGKPFTTTTASAVLGGDGKSARDKLVGDYNNLRNQINQLAQDASFNGVNLLNGDTLKVIFNEKNTSSLSIKGTATDSDTLGLDTLTSDDFKDSTSINSILDSITSAQSTLQNQSATLGSNLSVVQNRQDFTKNLVTVLDTGSSNLTSADLNEEAANSTALSTRQSLAISSLSLANSAQQQVLRLLQ